MGTEEEILWQGSPSQWTNFWPFVMRLVGIGNVELETSDVTTPVLWIRGVPDADSLREMILKAVDAVRDRKGVRELDVSDRHLG